MFHGVRFELFGPVRGWRDDGELKLGSPQQRALLAMLLLAGGRQLPLETIVDGLWGDDIPKAATGTVRTYISRLRGYLAAPAPGGTDVVITSVSDGYVLEPGTFTLDISQFQDLTAQARTARGNGDTATAARLMRDALACWRGTPLSGIPGPWAEASRLHLGDLCMAVLEERLTIDVTSGDHAAAIPELRALLRTNPYHEGLAGLLMRAYYKSGRQAEALGVYQETRRKLRDELGIDPGQALRDIHQRILGGDRGLLRSATDATPDPAWSQVVRLPIGQRQREPRCGPPVTGAKTSVSGPAGARDPGRRRPGR